MRHWSRVAPGSAARVPLLTPFLLAPVPRAGDAEEKCTSLKSSVEALRALYHAAEAEAHNAEGVLARSKMAGLALGSSELEEAKVREPQALVKAEEPTAAG